MDMVVHQCIAKDFDRIDQCGKGNGVVTLYEIFLIPEQQQAFQMVCCEHIHAFFPEKGSLNSLILIHVVIIERTSLLLRGRIILPQTRAEADEAGDDGIFGSTEGGSEGGE